MAQNAKNGTQLEQDIVFGIVYVPPAQSRFFNEDEFERFETEITSMCSSYDFVYISGDINARTAELCDFTPVDEFLSEYFDFDQETMQFYDQKSTLESISIQLNRKSQDNHTNAKIIIWPYLMAGMAKIRILATRPFEVTQ